MVANSNGKIVPQLDNQETCHAMAEFLPLCDVLFNVISLAGYFCDVVFDVVMGYALLERGYNATFAATISIVVTSLVITQVYT